MHNWTLKQGGIVGSGGRRHPGRLPSIDLAGAAIPAARRPQPEPNLNPYQASTRQERLALSAVAFVATASLLSGLLWLFASVPAGQVWAGLPAPAAGQQQGCADAARGAAACPRQLAATPAPLPPDSGI